MLVVPNNASAQEPVRYGTGITGNDVMKVCKDPNWRPGSYDPCGSLLIGIVDGLEWGNAICRPYGVVNLQISQIAYDAIQKHPEVWDRAAGYIIKQRLATLYPCHAKK